MPNMLVKFTLVWTAIIVLLIIFVGFAGHNDLVGMPNAKGHLTGFWFGLAHGFLSLIGLIVSIFNKNVNIYEVHNTGLGYNVGFITGILVWGISSRFYKG